MAIFEKCVGFSQSKTVAGPGAGLPRSLQRFAFPAGGTLSVKLKSRALPFFFLPFCAARTHPLGTEKLAEPKNAGRIKEAGQQ